MGVARSLRLVTALQRRAYCCGLPRVNYSDRDDSESILSGWLDHCQSMLDDQQERPELCHFRCEGDLSRIKVLKPIYREVRVTPLAVL